MAHKTQMRLHQISGSIIDLAYTGSLSSPGADTSLDHSGMHEILGHIVGSIGRIHGRNSTGANAFTNAAAGTFYATLKSDSAGNVDLGSTTDADKFGDIFVADTKGLTLGNAEEHTIKDAAGGLEIDSSEAIAIESSGGAISIGADNINQNINIGTDGQREVTIGDASAANSSGLTLRANTGGIDIDCSQATGALSLDTAGGAIEIGVNAAAGNISIGTNATARNVVIGNTTGASAVAIDAGTGGLALASTGTGDITIDSDDTLLLDSDGVLELNSSAGAISIGNDDIDQNINIGTDGERTINISRGGKASTVNIGNATGASAVDIDAGTGGVNIESAASGGIVVNAGATMLLDSAGVMQLNSSTDVISIGNDNVNQNIEIGADGARTINIGSETAGDTVAINVKAVGSAGNDVTVSSSAGSVNILAGEADNNAVVIEATNSSGRIQLKNNGSAIAEVTSGGILVPDAKHIRMGSSSDLEIKHDSGNSLNLVTSANHDLVLDNTATNKKTINRLGTDTDATAFEVQNNSESALFAVKGDGTIEMSGGLSVAGDFIVKGTTSTISSSNMVVKDPIVALGLASSSLSGGTITPGAAGDRGFTFPMEHAFNGSPAFFWDHTSISSGAANGYFKTVLAAQSASGSETSITPASNAPMMSEAFYVDGTANYIELDTDLKIIAAADVVIDPAGGELKVDGNVIPNSDSADDLGASGTAWRNLYVDAIDLNGQGSISMGGTGRIDLDADDDTSIRASADDTITIEVGGNDKFSFSDTAGFKIIDDVTMVFGSDNDVTLKYDEAGQDVLEIDGEVLIVDDKKLYFGNGKDASFEYDEDGTDTVFYRGANLRINDDVKLEFGAGGDASFEYDEDGTDTLLYAGASMRFSDDTKLEFGVGGDASIEYDEDGDDVVQVAGASWRFFHGTTGQIQFRDSAIAIGTSADGVMTLDADGNIDIETDYIQLGNGSDNGGRIRLLENSTNGTNYVNFGAPEDLGGNYTFFLPNGNGSSGQILQTNGSGVTSWVDAGGQGNSIKTYATVQDAVHPANTGLSDDGGFSVTDYSNIQMSNASKVIDVYVNGQLLQSGSGPYSTNIGAASYTSGDYLIDFSDGGSDLTQLDVKFAFALEKDDVVCIVGRA